MDFNYYEKVKKNIIDEYNNNLEKINDLNKKINLLEWDNVYNKLTRVFAFSVVPWIIGLIFIITNKINFNIPVSVISFLSMSSPILIGGVIEKIVSKKLNLKSKFNFNFNIFEDEFKRKLELDKICNRNKLLTSMLNDVNNEYLTLRYVFNNYGIMAQEKSEVFSKVKSDVINRQQQMLEEKENDFDVLVTKKFLSNDFFKVRSKQIKKTRIFQTFVSGGALVLLMFNLPSIALVQFNPYLKYNVLLNIVGSFFIGGVLSGGIYLKWCNDILKVFKEINDELGENKLSDNISDDEDLDYSLKLKECMNEICEIKIKLEKNKYDLDNIDLSNEHESKKINNYCYNYDSNLDKSEHEFNYDKEISMENSVHLSRKRVKDMNNNL